MRRATGQGATWTEDLDGGVAIEHNGAQRTHTPICTAGCGYRGTPRHDLGTARFAARDHRLTGGHRARLASG